MDYNQILPKLFVGTYPEGLADIDMLKERCGVTAVLNLQSDEDLGERRLNWSTLETLYTKAGIDVRRVAMRDFDYVDQRRMLPEAVKTLAELLNGGHVVYLHCNAGAGRSPLVAMALLYWCGDKSLEEAVRYVKERRDCAPTTELLEVARRDILRTREKEVARRAFDLHQARSNLPDDPLGNWVDAEREILEQTVCGT